jgi:hypothetical protein
MKKMLLASAIAFALIVGAGVAQAVEIIVTPTLAPNIYGSPSYADWQTNALTALENGQTSGGAPGTPSYYQATSNITQQQAIVTGFPSWMGQLNPGTTVGPNFANEYGNRMQFGLSILGDGQEFSISELSFNAVSNDPGNVLGFGYSGGYDYGDAYVGVIFGQGGAANTYITSGPDDQLVDALFSRGSGNSNAAYCTGVCDAADQAAALAGAIIPDLTQFTGTYSLSNSDGTFASGSGTFNFLSAVPEPTTWVMMILGLGGVGVALRRRRVQPALAV